MVELVLDKLEKEYMGKVKIGKLNVDRNPVTAAKYQIKGVPTFVLFQTGKITRREVGAKSEKQIRQLIDIAIENVDL